MQTPADSIPQLDAMRMGVEFRQAIQLRDFRLMVRPLSIGEHLQVTASVVEQLSHLPQSAQNRITENTMLSKEILKLASTSDVGETDFQISEYILDRMTPDELSALYKQWVAVTDRVNPSLEQMPTEKLQELVADIKKKEDLDRDLALIELSHSDLVNLVRFLLINGG